MEIVFAIIVILLLLLLVFHLGRKFGFSEGKEVGIRQGKIIALHEHVHNEFENLQSKIR